MPSPTYSVKERVLCYHGPLIYEAKVLHIRFYEDNPQYFVHYRGWKVQWDEWVTSDRLLKWTEPNQAKAKELRDIHEPSGKRKKNLKKEPSRGTKRKHGDDNDDGLSTQNMRLHIPDALKKVLADDYERIKHRMLVRLRRSPNVYQILQNFEAYLIEKQPQHLRQPELLASTITSGFLTYFEKFCPTNLLYKFERQQFAEMKAFAVTGQHVVIGQEESPVLWYGAEHLLRLLVAMPRLTASASMDKESLSILKDFINELFLYMEERKEEFFNPDSYWTPSDYYIELANAL